MFDKVENVRNNTVRAVYSLYVKQTYLYLEKYLSTMYGDIRMALLGRGDLGWHFPLLLSIC